MAGKGDIEAGKAFVRLFVKDDTRSQLAKFRAQFSSAMTAAAPVIAAVSTAAAGLAAATAAAGAALKEFADAGSEINDVAARTGMATDQLQMLRFAATQTGASLEDVERAARAMVKNGFNVGDFEAIGARIAAIEDPSRRAAEAMEVFGKGGTKLLPMFAEFAALKGASAAAGEILSAEEVARADALGDAFGALQESVSRLMQQIGAELAPAMQRILETTVGITASLSESVDELAKMAVEAGKFAGSGLAALFPGTGMAKSILESTSLGAGIGAVAGAIPGAFESRGHRAVAGMAGRTRGMPEDEWGAAGGGGPAAIDAMKAVNAEFEKRQRLIRSFESPQEAFLRREKEIVTAIQQAIQAGNSFMIPFAEAKQQVGQLQTALGRLRRDEAERRMRELGLPGGVKGAAAERQAEMESPRGPKFSAASSFSAAGAVALGFGGGGGPWGKLAAAFEKGSRLERRMATLLEDIKRNTERGRAVFT